MKDKQHKVKITIEADIADAVFVAHTLCGEIGFTKSKQFMVATAVSELARNIFFYAGTGEIILKEDRTKDKPGIEVIAKDHGPGIENFRLAMSEGYSTGGTLGFGLPGAARLMDELHFDEKRKRGTKIVARKWI